MPRLKRPWTKRWGQDLDETTTKVQRHDPWNEIHPDSDIHKIS
jgi:hypothetical protein